MVVERCYLVKRKRAPLYVVLQTAQSRLKSSVYELLHVLLGSALIAVGAKTKFMLPLAPVPFTLQTMFLHYLLFTLGRKAWRSVATYIALGLAGVPLFALGGGPLYVLSPTFGYVAGFLLGTVVAGWIIPTGALSLKRGLVAGLTQLLIIYTAGVLWLSLWYSLVKGLSILQSFIVAVATGVAPFIVWDIVKLIVALHLARFTVAMYGFIVKRVSRV